MSDAEKQWVQNLVRYLAEAVMHTGAAVRAVAAGGDPSGSLFAAQQAAQNAQSLTPPS